MEKDFYCSNHRGGKGGYLTPLAPGLIWMVKTKKFPHS